MAILELYINGEKLDMYDNEKIVQSFSIINISDITKRFGEYSNQFKIPKTNNNLRLIDYSNYLNSTTQLPYSRIACQIYINGFLFKQGFMELVEIVEDIDLRFYTGNVGFYSLLKDTRLSGLRLIDLDHTWNLPTVVASRVNTSGFIYPLIDYNEVPTTGSTIDVRQLLPGYFDSTLMEACCVENGYELINLLSGSVLNEYNNGIIPTAKKNPGIPVELLAANLYEGIFIGDALEGSQNFLNVTQGQTIGWVQGSGIIKAGIALNNPSNLYGTAGGFGGSGLGTGIFTAAYSGLYKIHSEFDWEYNWIEQWTSSPVKSTTVYVSVKAYINGVPNIEIFNSSYATSVVSPTSYSFSGSVNNDKFVFLNAGDQLTLQEDASISTVATGPFSGALNVSYQAGFFVDGAAPSNLLIELQPGVQFNTPVQASFFLPEITQADYFKDTCLRYCIMPVVDESNKTVTLIQFDDIKNNIPNAVDWTNKVDQTNEKQIRFLLNDYAQKNNIKHKEDKSIEIKSLGSDYVLAVNNQNLEAEKDLYTSPFASSEMITGLVNIQMVEIKLYDIVTGEFSLDVEPRRCYTDKINTSISYTDGTNTIISTTDIPITWFIRSDKDYNMGFGNNQLNRYSSNLISILQGLKILNIDVRLNLLDILNLNYMYPIKIEDSFFILSIINQFCYNENVSTGVELIKIN